MPHSYPVSCKVAIGMGTGTRILIFMIPTVNARRSVTKSEAWIIRTMHRIPFRSICDTKRIMRRVQAHQQNHSRAKFVQEKNFRLTKVMYIYRSRWNSREEYGCAFCSCRSKNLCN